MTEDKVPSPNEFTFDENVALVLQGLPTPIRDFLTSPERDAATVRLSNRYHLHADQAGAFQKAFLFLLMGIHNPEQFFASLEKAGITNEMAQKLAGDVNEEVFKVIQQRERSSVATPPASQPAREPLVPAMELVSPTPVVPTEPPASNLQPPALPEVPAQEAYAVRTMAHDIEAVKEHRTPEAVPLHHSEPAPTSAFTTLPPPPQTVVRSVPPPPPNLPGAPIEKTYSVDPYREPME